MQNCSVSNRGQNTGYISYLCCHHQAPLLPAPPPSFPLGPQQFYLILLFLPWQGHSEQQKRKKNSSKNPVLMWDGAIFHFTKDDAWNLRSQMTMWWCAYMLQVFKRIRCLFLRGEILDYKGRIFTLEQTTTLSLLHWMVPQPIEKSKCSFISFLYLSFKFF